MLSFFSTRRARAQLSVQEQIDFHIWFMLKCRQGYLQMIKHYVNNGVVAKHVRGSLSPFQDNDRGNALHAALYHADLFPADHTTVVSSETINNRLEIVRYLVAEGVSVDQQTTASRLSPLAMGLRYFENTGDDRFILTLIDHVQDQQHCSEIVEQFRTYRQQHSPAQNHERHQQFERLHEKMTTRLKQLELRARDRQWRKEGCMLTFYLGLEGGPTRLANCAVTRFRHSPLFDRNLLQFIKNFTEDEPAPAPTVRALR